MKRMIKASWNGIVPQKKLIELGVPRKDAKAFQDWLYQNEYDSGFNSVEELFDTFDIHTLYDKMKGASNDRNKPGSAAMNARWKEWMNDEMATMPGAKNRKCIDAKESGNELILTLEYEGNGKDSASILTKDIIIPRKEYELNATDIDITVIRQAIFDAIHEKSGWKRKGNR